MSIGCDIWGEGETGDRVQGAFQWPRFCSASAPEAPMPRPPGSRPERRRKCLDDEAGREGKRQKREGTGSAAPSSGFVARERGERGRGRPYVRLRFVVWPINIILSSFFFLSSFLTSHFEPRRTARGRLRSGFVVVVLFLIIVCFFFLPELSCNSHLSRSWFTIRLFPCPSCSVYFLRNGLPGSIKASECAEPFLWERGPCCFPVIFILLMAATGSRYASSVSETSYVLCQLLPCTINTI